MSVLAIKIGLEHEMWNGAVDTGYRAVLKVRHILGKVQTTRFYGDTLHLLWNHAGQLDPQQAFKFFCDQYKDKPMTWGELTAPPPNPLMYTRRIYLVPTPPPDPPVAEAVLKVIDSGYDPAQGYFVEFLGNYWLHIPLFKGFQNVKRVFE